MQADHGASPLVVGQMLDDKYRIDELLDIGGMGAVYVGTHTKLRKRVAIKILRTELSGAQEMVERFLREAVAASRIGHENIVEVTDVGKAQNQAPFIVMELLEGENLARRIKRRGPLPVPESCHIASEILSAVDAAHRAGIVHRDLKPENVFLTRKSRSESVKILDFGISRMVQSDEGHNRLTLTGLVMGTPYYMSPEQACGESEITAAADVYSVGVILYETLTAKVPFEGTNYNSLIFKVVSGQFPPPRTYVALPEPLEQIVLRAMALKPADRFPSASEMAQALEPFAPVTSPSHPFPLRRWSPTPAGGFAAQRSGSLSPASPASAVPLRIGPVGSRQLVTRTDTVAAAGPEREPDAARTLTDHTSIVIRGRSRGVFAAIAAGVLLAGAGVGIALVQLRGRDADQTPRPRAASAGKTGPSPAPAPAATTAPVPPAAEEAAIGSPAPSAASAAPAEQAPDPAVEPVTVTLVVTPADAVIRAGGKLVQGRRLTASHSSPEILVEVSRRGYISKQRMVSFTANRVVEVVLERKHGARRSAGRGHRTARPTAATGVKRIITDSP